MCLRVPGAAEDRLRPLFRGMCVSVGLQENAKLIGVGYKQQIQLAEIGFQLAEMDPQLAETRLQLAENGSQLAEKTLQVAEKFP